MNTPTTPHSSANGRPLEQCQCGALIEPWLVGDDGGTIYQDTAGGIACNGYGDEMILHKPEGSPA